MSAPVTVGTVIAERYRVENVLGAGGMGIVVKATHLLLQQPVAIKFLRRELADSNAVHQLLSEAQAAAKVQSDHVVRIHDVAALADGTPYIVMEYLEGTDLGTVLAQGPLHPSDAVRYALQTCHALAETHAAGMVHGDLKPENIYIAKSPEGGKVKLLDFGISQSKDRERRDGEGIVGTPLYMAPEQFEGGATDGRTDLWALGAVLYEMLTGRPPFVGKTTEETAELVMTAKVPPIERASVPPELASIITRCLAKRPIDRFPSALELTYALEPHAPQESSALRLARSASHRATQTSQRQIPTVVLPRSRSHPGRWVLAIALATLVIVVGLVVFTKLRPGALAGTKPANPVPSQEPEETASPVVASAEPSSEPARPITPPVSSSKITKRPKQRPPRAPATTPAPAEPPAPPPPPPAPPPSEDRFGTRK